MKLSLLILAATAAFTLSAQQGARFARDRPGSSTIELPLTTIDKLVAGLGMERVDFIKVDMKAPSARLSLDPRKPSSVSVRAWRCACTIWPTTLLSHSAVLKIDPSYRFECACMYSNEGVTCHVAHFRSK